LPLADKKWHPSGFMHQVRETDMNLANSSWIHITQQLRLSFVYAHIHHRFTIKMNFTFFS